MAERPPFGRHLETARTAATVVLAIVFLASLLGAGYVAIDPPAAGTPYSELSIRNDTGVAAGYDTNLTTGETGVVRVGVGNEERETVSYRLLVRTDDRTVSDRNVTLADGETWDERITYAFEDPGVYRLRFLLYRGPALSLEDEPHLQNRLIIYVSNASAK